jgi:hypothetical protein
MKYIFSLVTFFLLGMGFLHAQIILDHSVYPASVIGVDSLKKTTTTSAFPVFSSGSGSWDMSIVSDTSPIYFAYRVPCFGYQYADSTSYRFIMFDYRRNIEANISAIGIFEYANKIDKGLNSITAMTSGPLDSLIIDSQVTPFSSPHTKIAFPATYNSAWSSSYYSDLHFHLTILALGDTLAPGFVRTYITEKDSVTGWGKMRVKDALGSPSDYNNVLQVQTMTVRTDSFFLNGAPLSSVLLTTLGLTQGHKDTTYEHYYYRKQEVTPLAQVAFRDAGYTQPYTATTHVQRLSTVSTANVDPEQQITIYPNPADGIITIEAPAAIKTFEIYNVMGQLVLKDVLRNQKQVTLSHLQGGSLYYIRLADDKGAVVVKTITLRPN